MPKKGQTHAQRPIRLPARSSGAFCRKERISAGSAAVPINSAGIFHFSGSAGLCRSCARGREDGRPLRHAGGHAPPSAIAAANVKNPIAPPITGHGEQGRRKQAHRTHRRNAPRQRTASPVPLSKRKKSRKKGKRRRGQAKKGTPRCGRGQQQPDGRRQFRKRRSG